MRRRGVFMSTSSKPTRCGAGDRPNVDPDPPTVNDVSPHFMPDADRVSPQRASRSHRASCSDEASAVRLQQRSQDRARFVLEVMNEDGTGRPPDLVQPEQRPGRDAYSRSGRRVAGAAGTTRRAARTPCPLFSNPDGTDAELYYGANSHMDRHEQYGRGVPEAAGDAERQHLTLVAPVLGYDFGGDLTIIDGKNFVENIAGVASERRPGGPARHAHPRTRCDDSGLSAGGRFNQRIRSGTHEPHPGELGEWRVRTLTALSGPCTSSSRGSGRGVGASSI